MEEPFDVIVLVSSAGGLGALSMVLRDMPPGFPCAVVVAMHLAAESQLPELLTRRTALSVVEIEQGTMLRAGTVHVCPARARLELLPDRSCALLPSNSVVRDRPFDALLSSLADSYGTRAMAVVLTGMNKDGALGARAVKQAGGAVLVQSEETAEFVDMPRAVIESGVADLVSPVQELGKVILGLAMGDRFPRPRNEAEACEALFAGEGEARAALRLVDWESTPFGPVQGWPQSLKASVTLVLHARFPACIFWGRDFAQIYNDGFVAILNDRHPAAAGRAARATWGERWAQASMQYRQVLESGVATSLQDYLFEIEHGTHVQEAYFRVSLAPIHDDDGRVAGVLNIAFDTTEAVLSARRLDALRALAATARGDVKEASERSMEALSDVPQDLPFAMLYTIDEVTRTRATLRACAGVAAGSVVAPELMERSTRALRWPVFAALAESEPTLIEDLALRFPGFTPGPWPEPPRSALIVPLQDGANLCTAVLICGLSARLPFDASYRNFMQLVGARLGSNLAEATQRQRERSQLAQLSELDRVKTDFFSNVSHEFRTPLTLLLAPLEDLLHVRDQLPAHLGAEVEQASRNARRLLNLVDTLLDFSQIEANRLYAKPEATQLHELTQEIAGLFRSAAQRAGLALVIDCPPLPEPVWVDRAMWEKIVSNLLSNALKFTFRGEIRVSMRTLRQHVELTVADTGVGIAEAQQPEIFRRFHRVRGVQARTQEGAGIGLSLVHELTRLHAGRVRVKSRLGEGSTFTVWLPTGRRGGQVAQRRETTVARELASQAERWVLEPHALPESIVDTAIGPRRPQGAPSGERVLFVDDNGEMRDYMRRLLSERWQVEVVEDGAEALERARTLRPDLILTDVMMPRLDGFALLRAIRSDPALKSTPVVLGTARADENAAIEGLLAGADDYIAKPFSARELVARVGAQLELARTRLHNEQRLRELLALMPAGVLAYDADGTLTFSNQRATELLGSAAPELAIASVLRTGEPIVDRELRHERPDGSCVELLMNVSPLRNGDGAVNVLHDVSELKRAQAALEALNRQLEQRVTQRTAALEASRARQQFLLQLGDALREAKDLEETERVACSMLRAHLDAGGVYYVEHEADGSVQIRQDQRVEGLESVAGRYGGNYVAEISDRLVGDLLVVPDIDEPGWSESIRALNHARAIRAFALTELVKDARTRVWLTVTYAEPHAFSDYELSLQREVTERMWGAMEASRALRLMAASEARYRALAGD